MLEQKYVDNLIKLRDWLLANREVVKAHLNFNYYVKKSTESCLDPGDIKDDFIKNITGDCNTVCCAIGWAAISNLFPRESTGDWDDFALQNFGLSVDCDTGGYLFGIHNPPHFDLMIERFDYVIANRIAPEEYTLMKSTEN
jgi:hypothetical protein